MIGISLGAGRSKGSADAYAWTSVRIVENLQRCAVRHARASLKRGPDYLNEGVLKGLFDNEPPPEEEEDQLKGVRPDWSKEGYRIWIATRATRNLETVRHRRCFSSYLWGAPLALLLAKLQVAVWSGETDGQHEEGEAHGDYHYGDGFIRMST